MLLRNEIGNKVNGFISIDYEIHKVIHNFKCKMGIYVIGLYTSSTQLKENKNGKTSKTAPLIYNDDRNEFCKIPKFDNWRNGKYWVK